MTQAILLLLKADPMASLATLSKATGVSTTTVNYHLRKLIAQGKIKPVVQTAKWQILEDATQE
jgi:predicted ArsR family transcriptional regulator